MSPQPRSAKELDQEYSELLSELRVILPGIQLLAGFLLIAPFSFDFRAAPASQRLVYFVAFVSAVSASALTIAPSSQHRIRWREGDKEALLQAANNLTIAGSVALAISMAASVFLVGQLVYGNFTAAVVMAVLSVAMAWWWFLQPLVRRRNDNRRRQ